MSYAPILTLPNMVWLLAAMAFVIAPHAARLPIWVTLTCIAAGAWRWWIARRGARTPPWWAMALFAIAVTAGARLEYGRLFGREVGVMLLIAMLCLKVLEMKNRRDALIAIFMGFFLAMTNFFYSQSILMGFYLMGCVVIFFATLIGYNRTHGNATWRERLKPSFMMMLQAIPLMLVLFFLFPRLSGPLWRMPGEEGASTGLSDQMTPGDISKLSKSTSVAFRVDFEGAVPDTSDLYWRGPVLTQNLGRTWRANATWISTDRGPDLMAQSKPINYKVTLQPHNKPWLFALDMPVALPKDASLLPDYQLRSRTLVTSLRAYEVSSVLRFRAGSTLSERERRENLSLYPGFNPRSRAYAADLKARFPDPKLLIDHLFQRYNREFEYTFEPPLLAEHPVDEFLFDSKKGFCEHYAGSFVFVLRAAGIPARVVTGYQGGETNPITRQLVVRQSEAHAWAEVWFDDLGWVRADPTFAVSPLRINRGIADALGPLDAFDTVASYDKLGVLKQLAYSWDALNNQWNQWVVGFNQDRQRFAMASWFGVEEADWRDLAKGLLIGVGLVGGLAALWIIGRAYCTRRAPLERSWAAVQEKMARAGLPRAPHEAPYDYLHRIAAGHPQYAKELSALVDAFVGLKYADANTRTIELAQFATMVRRFKPAKFA
jgi:transglutaminase-like putative cysteine protease